MLDRETLQLVLDQITRLKQDHPDAGAPLIAWTVEQMLDRSTDRWDDGFRAGISSRVDVCG